MNVYTYNTYLGKLSETIHICLLCMHVYDVCMGNYEPRGRHLFSSQKISELHVKSLFFG
jgi:hypothetical protein